MFVLFIGFIQEDRLRELLTTMGDRFTDEDVSINRKNYIALVICLFCIELRGAFKNVYLARPKIERERDFNFSMLSCVYLLLQQFSFPFIT